MIEIAPKKLGKRSDPHDVRQLRSQSYDYHRKYGFPVVFKHAWNEQDVDAGTAYKCPYCYDQSYAQPRQWDPYCFGTGYLGGYSDGVIVYCTISNSQEDTVKVNEAGLLTLLKESLCTAPWYPKMEDGDLLIEVDYDPITKQILSLGDRYYANKVDYNRLRGTGYTLPHEKFTVHQSFQVTRLPYGHQSYQVPITFDYDNLPAYPENYVGVDPDRTLDPERIAKLPPTVLPVPPDVNSTTRNIRATGTDNTPSVTVVFAPED